MRQTELQKHIQTLDEGDDAAQRQAVHALKSIEAQDWSAIPQPVVNALLVSLQRVLLSGTKPPLVHKEIAIILGNLGPRSKSAVPQLIELLQEGIPDSVREAAATALGKLGREARDAVDPLIALCSGQTGLAFQAIRALSEIGCADQRVRSALVNLWASLLHSQNNLLQVAVALCKLRIDAKGLVGFLTNHLIKSQDDGLRKSAADALGWCNKNEIDVVPALVTASLSDKNEEVRQIAQGSVDRLGLSQSKAILICGNQLKDSLYAEAALRKSGQPAVPALIEALGSPDALVRVKAARILACLGELAVDAVPALRTALHDRDAEIRLAAAKGLWNVTKNADDVVLVLVQLLEDKAAAHLDDSEARRQFLQTVIEALWRIGPTAAAAVPALSIKAKDKNRLVSQSAQLAIKKILAAAG